MIKQVLLYIAKFAGLFALSRRLTRNRLRILAYHGIWFSDGHFGNHLFMSPEKFEDRMRWLSKAGYPVISLAEAMAAFLSGKTIPYGTVITIDDGWYGTYRHMVPILEEHGLPATLYVYSEAVESQEPLLNILVPALFTLTKVKRVSLGTGQDLVEVDLTDDGQRARLQQRLLHHLQALNGAARQQYLRDLIDRLELDYHQLVTGRQFSFMTFEEIADAHRRGLDIQLHTHTHSARTEAPAKLKWEIDTNRAKLKNAVQTYPDHFCYPSGVYSRDLFQPLKESGIVSATLTVPGLVSLHGNPYTLPRIVDGQMVSKLELEAELAGFLELVRKLREWKPVLSFRFLSPEFIAARHGRKIGFLKLLASYWTWWRGGYHSYASIDWNRVHRLVFICSGNICRSAYGEARAHFLGLRTASAGLNAVGGGTADPQAIRIATERGIDLQNHRTTPFKAFEPRNGDLFLCMEPSQARAVREQVKTTPGVQVTLLGFWSRPPRPFLQDPYGLKGAYWQTCFDLIDSAIDNLYCRVGAGAHVQDGESG